MMTLKEAERILNMNFPARQRPVNYSDEIDEKRDIQQLTFAAIVPHPISVIIRRGMLSNCFQVWVNGAEIGSAADN